MWFSTLISNSSAFKPLIISLNYFIIKKEVLKEQKRTTIQDFLSCTWNVADLFLKNLK